MFYVHRIPCRLKELILDRNDIREVPEEVGKLGDLQHLSLADNLVEILPGFILEMRALALTVSTPQTSRTDVQSRFYLFLFHFFLCRQDVIAAGAGRASNESSKTAEEKSNLHNSLYKVNLRNNQLKGNIILGNYGVCNFHGFRSFSSYCSRDRRFSSFSLVRYHRDTLQI